MEPITINGTRIMRPSEATTLINGIQKRDNEIKLKALLFSGLRFVEAQRLYDHHGWYDGGFIRLPEMAVKKALRRQRQRYVRLSPLGREIVRNFLDCNTNLPSWQTWRENLHRWAENAHLDATGFSPKSTRKSWESWLVFYYPDRLANILLSQGHTFTTSIQHYLNMPFTEEDKRDMREFVEGWI